MLLFFLVLHLVKMGQSPGARDACGARMALSMYLSFSASLCFPKAYIANVKLGTFLPTACARQGAPPASRSLALPTRVSVHTGTQFCWIFHLNG